MTTYISCAETAKLIRQELKSNFPGIKFSVRSKEYSGGASIRVEWLDGPSDNAVEYVVGKFEGATFDPSIDLKSYVTSEWEGEEVNFGADYIHCNRRLSRVFLETVLQQFCKRFGTAMPTIQGKDDNAWIDAYAFDHHDQHWYRELIRNTDVKDMHRAYAAQDERDARGGYNGDMDFLVRVKEKALG